ncbi:PREDICTED: probable pectinesterase/pectinesterase inhibitor 20 [Camelina sativa]|uniref:Pectinesterase n=1 Tax=Camelina sativa TaxID=90675 RepID=A0ABM0ZAM6_CAMSA|nr:PREDICTED: probable pectinesterase/pectinesterase inhibitor 20 [Camelina sativa]
MSQKLMFLFTLACLSLLPSLLFSAEIPATGNATSPSNVCRFAPDPSYCRSVLPNQPGDIYSYGRFSLRRSLSRARRFISLIDDQLNRKGKVAAKATVGALEDCKFLASRTMDFLLSSSQTADSTKTLSLSRAEDVHTFLSAAITNEQTCLEGLKSTASENGLSGDIFNDTKLYGVSLALFSKGWVPRRQRSRPIWQPQARFKKFFGFRNGRLPLKMTERARAVYNTVTRSGRKLLQAETDAVQVSDIVTVIQNGTGNFTTINEAIAAAPNKTDGSNGYFLIYVTAGLYEETTFNSATFILSGPNFIGVNITIRNTAGPTKGQAVALRSGGDLSVFYSCSFEAYQDTLYTHSLRQFYRECDVYGTVDFIFGNAAVVLQNCNLYPRQPRKGQSNEVTAQGRTDPNQNTGTAIHGCTIRPADDLATSNYTVKTFLGRPWKEYSRTVVMQTYIDAFLEPSGWNAWSGDFALSTLYYAEYNNTGPGSNTTNRVTWPGYHVINATDASNFTVTNFLVGEGWLGQTGVPFVGGLIA